jgi:hypothetical protein
MKLEDRVSKNRIAEYIDSVKVKSPRCVITSDELNLRVTLSLDGKVYAWFWDEAKKGILCPGASEPTSVHPYAAEALVEEEIQQMLSFCGLDSTDYITVNSRGEAIPFVIFEPNALSSDSAALIKFKKNKVKELYHRFVYGDDKLTPELIEESISFGLLEPLLTLVNL